MLAPGIVWTEGEHPEASRPLDAPRDLATIPLNSPFEARRAADNTPYCIACNTSLLPVRTGRQGATCREHKAERTAQRVRASRAQPAEVDFVVTLSREEARQLLRSLDKLATAVGRAASYFEDDDQNTWQHKLLLASKELTRVSDANLRAPYLRARASFDTFPANPTA